MLGLDARHHVEQLGGKMHRRAVARRWEIKRARLLLRQRNQVAGAFNRQRGMHAQNQRRGGQHRDRREIFLRVPAQFGVQALVGRQEKRRHQQRVAVGGTARSQFRGDVAAGAGARIDRDLLTQILGELAGEVARDDVARSAGRKRVDHADRLDGIGL